MARNSFFMQFFFAPVVMGALLFSASPPAEGAWMLAEDGVSRSVVVISGEATAVERHAADELAYFLSKVTGAEIRISETPVSGKFPLWLGTPDTNPAIGQRGLLERVGAISDQGFLLYSDGGGLVIAGSGPLGVLFGAYAFLEEYAGMRWFFPGEEGEYCPEIPRLKIGRINEVQEPSFRRRTVHFSRVSGHQYTPDTWDWAARNRMQLRSHPGQADEYEKRGAYVHSGGHVLSRIVPDELFEEHPEYFGKYDGERRRQMGQRGQPCTTHPEVIKMTLDYMVDWFDSNPDGVFTLNSNDYPNFCECENCVALDPEEERERPGGRLSTRFFTFKDEVSRQVREARPGARIRTLAYQRYRLAPAGVVPDPELWVTLCDVGRCFRHSLDDEDCNHFFREMFEGWSSSENPRGYFPYYNMIGGHPREGIIAVPMENIVASDMRYMHRLGHEAWSMRVRPPDANYPEVSDTPATRNEWRANYPWFYMQAKLAWDIDRDLEAMMDEMNEKLYGPAAPAMGRYRALIRRLWEETPGHFVYGTPFEALGLTMLSFPGAEDKLISMLDEAYAAASGYPEYRKRVAEERRIFEKSWMLAQSRYAETQYEDITVSPLKGSLAIDGRLDEPDWLDCEPVTGFIRREDGQLAEAQTLVRLLYDEEYLYVGLEMEEPHAEQLVVNVDRRDDIRIFRDDTIELFIDPDGEGLSYVHIAVNPAGEFRDSMVRAGMLTAGDVGFDSGARVASRAGEDRWTVELKVPAENLGGVIRVGERWLMDVCRARKPGADGGSSWMKGSFHVTENFRGISFGEKAN